MEINQLIERSDYINASTEIIQVSQRAAGIILRKMKELDILYLEPFSIQVSDFSLDYNSTETHLTIDNGDDVQNILDYVHPLNSTTVDGIHLPIATVSDRIKFANVLPDIIEYLNQVEDSKCKLIEDAISKFSEIISL